MTNEEALDTMRLHLEQIDAPKSLIESFEQIKRELGNLKVLRELNNIKHGTKVVVDYCGKTYHTTVADIEFDFFRTEIVKELGYQMRLFKDEYRSYWRLGK